MSAPSLQFFVAIMVLFSMFCYAHRHAILSFFTYVLVITLGIAGVITIVNVVVSFWTTAPSLLYEKVTTASRFRDLEVVIKKLASDITNKDKQILDKDLEILDLKQRLEQLEQLSQQENPLQQQIVGLQQEMVNLQQAHQLEVQQLKRQNLDKEQKPASAEADSGASHNDSSASQADVTALQTICDEKDKKIESLYERFNSIEVQHEELLKVNDQFISDIQRLGEELRVSQVENRALRKDASAHRSGIQEQVAAACREEHISWKKERESAHEAYLDLQLSYNQLQVSFKASTQAAVADACARQYAELEQKGLATLGGELQRQANAARLEYAKLEQEATAVLERKLQLQAEAANAKYEKLEAEYNGLKGKLDEVADEAFQEGVIQTNLELSEGHDQAIAAKESTIVSLKSKLAATARINKSFLKKKDEDEVTIDDLEEELKSATLRFDREYESAVRWKDQHDELLAENDNLQRKLWREQEKVDRLTVELAGGIVSEDEEEGFEEEVGDDFDSDSGPDLSVVYDVDDNGNEQERPPTPSGTGVLDAYSGRPRH